MGDEFRHHPVLASPWEYEIVGLNYQAALDEEPYLDLTLRRGTDVRRLRFFAPQRIELEKGFPAPFSASGIAILDVSDGQLEGIGVHVSDVVTGHDCRITFWARAVIAQ